VEDVFAALRAGAEDFREQPSHYAFVCLIYPIAGAMMIAWSAGAELLPMVYPLMSGFALLGPMLALGLMEISRRRERGEDTSWSHVIALRKSPALPSLVMMSLYLLMLFMVWMIAARALYLHFIGDYPAPGFLEFANGVFNHPNAMALFFWGNLVGFVLAAIALVISIVAFPLLLDRDAGAATAVHTSVRVSMLNPVPVAAWGLIVAVSLAIGMATMMVGLIVIMPILGHATWHLYRKLVVSSPR
jgi:uncharacterized membrane protein